MAFIEITLKKFFLSGRSYLKVWLYLIFVTSFVLTNAVKGTTPAFLFAFISIVIPIFIQSKSSNLFLDRFILLVGVYIILMVVSQFAVAISSQLPSSANLVLISNEADMLVRKSLFTQSLYLIPSFLLFVFVWVYFSEEHNTHLTFSLMLFVTFGFYNWMYFMLFGENGDFISNRAFGDDILNPAQFQTLSIAGLRWGRFVSLTGEPSMYAFAILPYCIYFTYRKSYLIAIVLFISLVLTFSGTFVLGLILWAISHLMFTGYKLRAILIVFAIGTLFLLLLPGEIVDFFIKEAFVDKINQDSYSGLERAENFIFHINYFVESPFLIKLVGVGFGAVRSTDMFSTLLVNTGILGFSLFTLLFAYPIFKLPKTEIGLKVGLTVFYFILMISVSEYSYPALWLLLGISYNQLDKLNTGLTETF